MVNLLIALAVAFAGWKLWKGPTKRAVPPQPSQRQQDDLMIAREILGVPPGAAPAEIRAAHRRLITAAHPDHGGSEEETRRLNIARDLLLKSPA